MFHEYSLVFAFVAIVFCFTSHYDIFRSQLIKNTFVIIFLDIVTLSAEELLSIIFNIEEGKEVCDDLGELEKEGT